MNDIKIVRFHRKYQLNEEEMVINKVMVRRLRNLQYIFLNVNQIENWIDLEIKNENDLKHFISLYKTHEKYFFAS